MGRPSILEGFFFGGFVCGLGDAGGHGMREGIFLGNSVKS